MGKQNDRKLIKTKFEGVFYLLSSKKDRRTSGPDCVYYFWYPDADGKGHWKTVGRHSKGERPQSARIARAKFLNELAADNNPAVREKVTVGDAVDSYVAWARAEGKHVDKPLQQYDKHLRARLHFVPVNAVTPAMLTSINPPWATLPQTSNTPHSDYACPNTSSLATNHRAPIQLFAPSYLPRYQLWTLERI